MRKFLNLFLVLILIFCIVSITNNYQIKKPSKKEATYFAATFRRLDMNNNNPIITERYYPLEFEKGIWKLIKTSNIAYLGFPFKCTDFKPSTIKYMKKEKKESKWIAVIDDEGNLWFYADSVLDFNKNYFDPEGYYHNSDDSFSILAD
jgi:hypothetical protein